MLALLLASVNKPWRRQCVWSHWYPSTHAKIKPLAKSHLFFEYDCFLYSMSLDVTSANVTSLIPFQTRNALWPSGCDSHLSHGECGCKSCWVQWHFLMTESLILSPSASCCKRLSLMWHHHHMSRLLSGDVKVRLLTSWRRNLVNGCSDALTLITIVDCTFVFRNPN